MTSLLSKTMTELDTRARALLGYGQRWWWREVGDRLGGSNS